MPSSRQPYRREGRKTFAASKRLTHLTSVYLNRVPHLRDGFIVAKVG
jgi:hypothetical protein